MGEIDIKAIGLGVKDVVLGIAAAAAGASGGAPAAEGVNKVGTGLDKLIAMIPGEDQKTTRGEKFDRADFSARPTQTAQTQSAQTQSAQTQSAQSTQRPPQEASSAQHAKDSPAQPSTTQATSAPQESSVAPAAWPPVGDARVTADHLSNLGWSRAKIQKILDGPEQTSLAEIDRREPKGFKTISAEGVRVAQADAAPVQPKASATAPTVSAESAPAVVSKKVANSSAVKTVAGRRVSSGGSETA